MSEDPGKYNATNPNTDSLRGTSIIARLQTLLKQQGTDGHWNHSPGMLGIYNGLECALAVVEGRKPEYRQSPDRWLDETENDRVFALISNLMHLLRCVGKLECNACPNNWHEVTMIFNDLDAAQAMHRTLGKLRRAAPAPAEEVKTFFCMGWEYPILADLGSGFYLVAHAVKPAIACSKETEAGFDYIGTPENKHEDVPETIRQRAINALMLLAAASPTYPSHMMRKGEA